LESRGVITGEQKRAWEAVRHKAAHGLSPDASANIMHVLTMFYRIIFDEIGYRGPATDWAAHHQA
jgi:hypothetical protein